MAHLAIEADIAAGLYSMYIFWPEDTCCKKTGERHKWSNIRRTDDHMEGTHFRFEQVSSRTQSKYKTSAGTFFIDFESPKTKENVDVCKT